MPPKFPPEHFLDVVVGSIQDFKTIEVGVLKTPVHRPIVWRSLFVRVLGVVAAGILCLSEGRAPVFVPQLIKTTGLSSFTGDSGMHTLRSQGNSPRRDPAQRSNLRLRQPQFASDVAVAERPAEPVLEVATRDVGTTLLETFVRSSVLMASSLASLVPFVQMSAGATIDWRPFLAGFFESLLVYTLDHLRDMRSASQGIRYKASGMNALKTLSLVGLAGFFACVGAAPAGRHLTVLLTFSTHLLLCVGYAKMKPRMPYMKAAYVAFCVVFMAVAAPAAYDPSLLTGFSGTALLRMIMVIVSISFTIENLQDLRDIREDKEAGVVTLPSGLGAEWTARILMLSQIACLVFQFGMAAMQTLPLRLDMLLVHVVCMLCAMSFSETTPKYLFQVILEPLYVSPAALLAVRALLVGA